MNKSQQLGVLFDYSLASLSWKQSTLNKSGQGESEEAETIKKSIDGVN